VAVWTNFFIFVW